MTTPVLRHPVRSTLVAALGAALAACAPGGTVLEGDAVGTAALGLDSATGFGSNPGNLRMYFSVPANLPVGRPLVVVLHGCGDTASNFAAVWSEWTTLSTQHSFALLFPEQLPQNNVGNQSCFNWFESVDQARGQGENESIRQMVDEMDRRFSIDRTKIYAVGFSAGGAMVPILLATHPELFSAGVAVAGVPYRCASDVFAAFSCMDGTVDRTATAWAELVTDENPGFAGPWPRLSIWQGLSDTQVNAANRNELVEQWTAVHGIDAVADETGPSVVNATRRAYHDAQGTTRVEMHEIAMTNHVLRTGWAPRMADFLGLTVTTPPVDAGTAPDAMARPDAMPAPDAAAPDAGVAPDAEGAPDASEPVDAGDLAPDAGMANEAPIAGEAGCTATGPATTATLPALLAALTLAAALLRRPKR